MADQHITLKAKRRHHVGDVVGHGGQIVASVASGRLPPAPLIQSDSVDMMAEFLDDPVPGSSRTSPVMKENKARLSNA
jgi:hypothetical protein